MVKYDQTQLSTTFGALADPTRRAILARLALGESSVSELAAPFQMSLPAISKHLRILESAQLIGREKQGRVHRLQIQAEPLKQAMDWIEEYRQFWESQFDSLQDYLHKQSKQQSKTGKKPAKK